MKSMDGNTAAAHVAYAFTEVAAIFPITPSSVMAELVDEWSAQGRKNLFGQQVKVAEMQSEGGAAGAVHGSLAAGALTTTFTASQGLLLMVPNLYKMAGELLPAVIHCSARALAGHALSIFGDHQDVMACRQTGFALLAATNPQEVMDLGAVAHLSAINGRVPFLHFFDGFRTSHEIQKVAVWSDEQLDAMLDRDAVAAYRQRALNPEHPALRGSAQNPDIFFQAKEAANPFYDKLPEVVEAAMAKVNEMTGADYRLFNYYGHPEAERVIVAMGSVCDATEEVIDYLTAKGEKVGLLKVRLYRPFAIDRFVDQLPKSVKKIAVLDRCKEPGSLGEPLYLDVISALAQAGRMVQVVGGRYGLGSKDVDPSCILAVYENLKADQPKNRFTVGIEDDVTHLSLPRVAAPDTAPEGTVSCKFWGLGSDGTVGANKNTIKIIGDNTDLNVQAYFAYDSKKSGGVTVSHLRFGKAAIKSTYFISKADFVACHNPSSLTKYDMTGDLKEGGTFLLNTAAPVEELDKVLPANVKRDLAKKGCKFFIIDGVGIAREVGMGGRINTILQAAFFKLTEIMPIEEAVGKMKEAATKTYGTKGEKIVAMNPAAIDRGLDGLVEVPVPAAWADVADDAAAAAIEGEGELIEFVRDVMTPMAAQKGDSLPVSAFAGREDGSFPLGTSAFEKRGIAVDVPAWDPQKCIQCNRCSLVCPHAVIRPAALSAEEAAAAPAALKTLPMTGKGCEDLKFTLTISPLDCTGCGSCAAVCPAKEKALTMQPIESQMEQQEAFNYVVDKVSEKALPFAADTIKGSQFKTPLLEFSGACAGCGETPYAKLVTQLYGDHMYVANATGCSSIWGGSAPSVPYAKNKQGRGPAWANSLFEDNAEFGYGMALAVAQRRQKLIDDCTFFADSLEQAKEKGNEAWIAQAEACAAWLAVKDDANLSREAGKKVVAAMEAAVNCPLPQKKSILDNADLLPRQVVWIFGGDGWAYDIGFGGLDHVLASGDDVNVLVFDTEVYSNTGGQSSKATPTGSVAQFAAAGKVTGKKDLPAIAMSYGNVYVASICMGADYQGAVRAIAEAGSYRGPSLIVAYAPCINHGIKGGMGASQAEAKAAVDAGYWFNFRYDPRRKAKGENPFLLDSPKPSVAYGDFLKNEVRYTSLELTFPQRAETLFADAARQAEEKYEALAKKAGK
ncbi:MAG: pyruvate:ferredoxin (flavodoxin) oxidoreductase [Clostridia bacterium]|nr:pyruvate:ferredoxin (flavodoxin) oxidoreductase [Clostridia bacterium]